jgi:hypothetical protein
LSLADELFRALHAQLFEVIPDSNLRRLLKESGEVAGTHTDYIRQVFHRQLLIA